uniref:Phosphoinositide phospholipase C n=1 Tax=Acrobeloides nanus TaxID=290746 RepID=A0A914C6T5_9BILA
MWNSGCHMVSLNYQTGDRSIQLNAGKFLANGRCGYVLKPSYLLDETFKPNDTENILGACPIHLRIEVIAGRNLARKDRTKGICSPFVEIEVVGLPCDSFVYRTDTATSNGLNPRWEQSFEFTVRAPEMALLRFLVEDGDFVGKTDPFIGQAAVFPLDSIRGGFRSVPLSNQFSEPIELSGLLVYVDIRPLDDPNTVWLNPQIMLQAGRLGDNTNHNVSTRSTSMASNIDRLSLGNRDSVFPATPTLQRYMINGSTRSESSKSSK